MAKIRNWENNYRFQQERSTFKVSTKESGTIIWSFHDAIRLPKKCEYSFIIETTDTGEAPEFGELKKALTEIVTKLDEKEGLESFGALSREEN